MSLGIELDLGTSFYLFSRKNLRSSANYSRKKVPSWMFDRVIKTPLS